MNGDAIFGTWGPFPAAEVETMEKRLHHRGDYRATASPGSDVLLGWRGNLPSANKSPLSTPLVCACSIVNRAELAALTGQAPGAELSDAELLWNLYQARGPQGFGYINGQFALALFDAAADVMILAVDNWASRPLSFAACAQGFAFASEYKALLALSDARARPNLSAVACLEATKYLPPGEGLLVDIRPVAPGTWVRLQDGQWTSTSYSRIRLEFGRARSEQSYISELRRLLLTGCERLLDGLDEVGVALSGGLDSTLTVGAIRAVAPRMRIYSYTVSFREDDPVLRQAAETASHFSTIHREIIIPVDDLPRLIPQLVWTMEDPVAREEMLVYLRLAEEAAKDVRYVMHGHLADILFGGMPRHVLVHLATSTPFFRQGVLDLYDYSQTGAAPKSLLGNLLVRGYYHGRRTPPPRLLSASFPAAESRLHLAQAQPLNTMLLESLKHPTEISGLERLHARWNLGYGSMFHDLDVAKFAFRIPDALKIKGLSRKYILRRAAEGILPPALASRPKDIIRMPRTAPLKSVLNTMARDLLGPDAVARRGLFDPDDVARLLRVGNSQFAEDHFYHLWTLLLMEIWMRTYVDGRGAGPIVIQRPEDGVRRGMLHRNHFPAAVPHEPNNI